MADPFAHGTPVGDYHSWVRPASEPCPDCPCCTVALCGAGREHLGGCGNVPGCTDREAVWRCPCGRGPGTVEATMDEMRSIVLALPAEHQHAAAAAAQAAARSSATGVTSRALANAMRQAAEQYRARVEAGGAS